MQDLTALSKKTCNRLIIKIGSALLVHPETGDLNHDWLATLAADIHDLHQKGIDIILVSSGSIALGRKDLGLTARPTRLEDAQAAAAVGQGRLAQAYADHFTKFQITTAQILLSLDDLENRRRYLNARGTLETLINHRIIPIINENDTVATSEIRFGDNDRLAARVGSLAKADLVILLSDIDGLYTENPKTNPDAQFIAQVDDITPDIEKMAGPVEAVSGGVGTGGMTSKIMAAKLATSAGCSLAVVQGHHLHPISHMIKTGRGTLFPAKDSPLAVRKQWLSSLQNPAGFLHIDAGAAKALQSGGSLLPVGVTSVDGGFDRGDLVAIFDPDGHLIAQGLVNFTLLEADKIKGHTSDTIADIIGYSGRTALVHRDDMVLF